MSFPVTIKKDASGNDAIRVHFAPQASATPNNNFVTLDAKNSSVTMNVKAKSIWISNGTLNDSNFELFAEMTGIEGGVMFTLTGPGIDA